LSARKYTVGYRIVSYRIVSYRKRIHIICRLYVHVCTTGS